MDLLAAIRVVAAGDAPLAPGITRRLIKEFAARSAPAPTMPTGITEREVLVLVAEGLSNSEIARHLHITHGTAKTHVGYLLTKLEVRGRVQLVVLAHRTGLADGSS